MWEFHVIKKNWNSSIGCAIEEPNRVASKQGARMKCCDYRRVNSCIAR